MEFMRPGLNQTALLTLAPPPGAGAASAQSPSAIPGMFRCPDCPLSGQTAGPASSGGDRTTFIPRVAPAFHEGQTFQFAVIARVLLASPLVLEELDSEIRTLGRDLKVVNTTSDPERDKSSCRIAKLDTLDLAAKQVVSTLRFNDLVTAIMEPNTNEQNPASLLAATWVLTNVHRVTGPVAYFQPESRAQLQPVGAARGI